MVDTEALKNTGGLTPRFECQQRGRGIEHPKLAERRALNVSPEPLDSLPLEQTLGVAVRETLDHPS